MKKMEEAVEETRGISRMTEGYIEKPNGVEDLFTVVLANEYNRAEALRSFADRTVLPFIRLPSARLLLWIPTSPGRTHFIPGVPVWNHSRLLDCIVAELVRLLPGIAKFFQLNVCREYNK